MKTIIKSILAMAALISVIPAKAEIIDTGKLVSDWAYPIPKRFTFDGEARLFVEDYNSEERKMTYQIYNSKFDVIETFSISYKAIDYGLCEMEIYDPAGVDCGRNIFISQTLFNKDAYYEWLKPYYEEIDGSDICTKIRVESQNGTIVAEIKAPSGYDLSSATPLYVMDNRNYMIVTMYNYEDEDCPEYCCVYEINPEDASVKMVGAPHRVSVDPTTPRRGTLVNVDLDNPANEGCKIVVTSTSGRTVMTKAIEPGSMGTTIDTARFERGMYIVTVTDGKTTRENTKIIIR